ncbi:unnamed protein product [Mytilus edulis]|uniref:Uncharacterized protein n=1 Tax=Mytilus edulis TaxID=6550 RepID=A0A8S3T0H9_MYTED|nr:unnamed protein product [Mytilus edulis]
MCILQQPNQSLINSKQAMQTIDTRTIDVRFYNVTIACEVYEANISVSLPTENTRLFFKILLENRSTVLTEEKSSQKVNHFSNFCLLSVLIEWNPSSNIAIDTFMFIIYGGYKNVLKLVCRNRHDSIIAKTIQYHSAPHFQTYHVYDTPEAGYLEVIDDTYEQYEYSENKEEEPQDGMTINKEELYEEIE